MNVVPTALGRIARRSPSGQQSCLCPTSPSTGRTFDLSFRCATALFGHAGIEWDLTGCTREELDRLRAWVSLHKRLRPLLHSGTVVRADLPDPTASETPPPASRPRWPSG